jgi:starch phosphorylase
VIESDAAAGEEAQDERDSEATLNMIEHQVVPRFYERDANGVPRAWTRMVKAAIKSAGLRFGAHRMLADYVERMYRPALASQAR